MFILSTIIETFLEAIFPLPDALKRLLSMSPEEAYAKLPKASPSPIPSTSAVFSYKNEMVTNLIWAIKYKKMARAVEIGSFALYTRLIQCIKENNSRVPLIIVPMPITPRRRRERGYNQCELIASKIKHYDSENSLQIVSDMLLRTHHLSRQTLKNRNERIESAKGIFSVNEKSGCPVNFESNIIVLDDVITTGSTIKEAIETMRNAGYKNVSGISLAH